MSKKIKQDGSAKKSPAKTALKIVGIVLAVILVICIGVFAFFLIADYRPAEEIKLDTDKGTSVQNEINVEESLFIGTSNLGYCGLDRKADFFMDGGTMSHAISEEWVDTCMTAMGKHFQKYLPQILFLQEVDEDADRSYHLNQRAYFEQQFKEYDTAFAYNYKVPFVPLPLNDPMGGVKSGILTLSSFALQENTRIALPGDMSWPADTCSLDRCFLISRIKTSDGKELVLVNLHLSAFDKAGDARKVQLQKLEKILETEYAKGNYVIAGGDWNHVLPGTDPTDFSGDQEWPFWLQKLPEEFAPKGFSWAVDGSYPSNRDVETPYEAGKNFRCNIDGFLVSDNLKISQVQTAHMDFLFSDHNPVYAELTFVKD